MQIEKRDTLYLVAVKYLGGGDIEFLIGRSKKDHITVNTSQSIF
jgi:hypothetical protein